MALLSRDEILDKVRAFFDLKPPAPSSAPSNNPNLTFHTGFYYKHLDPKLLLKKTSLMPNLIHSLSSTVDKVLQDVANHGISLSPVFENNMFPAAGFLKGSIENRPITDAYSVGQSYMNTTAYHSGLIASMLLLSPESPAWETLLVWSPIQLESRKDVGLDETCALHLKAYNNGGNPKKVWDSVEKKMRPILWRIVDESPILALWEIFAAHPDNEDLLRSLGEPTDLMHPESMPTIGWTPPRVRDSPPPVTLSWWDPSSFLSTGPLEVAPSHPTSAEESIIPPRRSNRTPKGVPTKNVTNRSVTQMSRAGDRPEDHNQTITLPSRTRLEDERLLEVMIKHVWLRAVHQDSTFVVFHCGTLERIAFRHRASQTLYVSNLIDVTHCENPGYGKIHVGLYMSIMHDILDRTRRQPPIDNEKSDKKRRRKGPTLGPKLRRPRTRAFLAKLEADEVEHQKTCDYLTDEVTRCDLLLLRMCYSVYNSSSPSFFLRYDRHKKDKVDFQPQEYLSVTLNSDIATGATGIVHGATIKFTSEKGVVCSMPVIVKFSMKADQRKALRHEYKAYRSLASSHVKGVPRVIGLFEDYHSEVLALVMTHTGTSLVTVYNGSDIVVEEPLRSGFLRILSDIHAAGVRHRDLRPENLTVDDEGRAYIIDFDMAEISPTEGAKSREVEHLTDLLDGHYNLPNQYPSERTDPGTAWKRSGSESGRSGSRSDSAKSSPGSHEYISDSTVEE